ncbi:uncharacterized protein LOC131929913 [Physella acuta]|uniref:uncharacterized protein LOC131929913 n=1 Tax=Physella acuta TaxID=109671 RepID=UPI0027DD16F8|nr:uncharacterized protein LOC131929913 [Physella acuta]
MCDTGSINMSLCNTTPYETLDVDSQTSDSYWIDSEASLEVVVIIDMFIQYGLCCAGGLAGMVGNLLSIVVLAHIGLANSTEILLLSLSFCDLVFCACSFVKPAQVIAETVEPMLGKTFETMWIQYMQSVKVGASFCSNTHVLVIAVERFVAVFFPFYASRFLTAKTTPILLVVCYMYVFVPVATFCETMFTHAWVKDAASNRTYAIVEYTRFYLDNYKTLEVFGRQVFNNVYLTTSVLIVAILSMAINFKLIYSKDRENLRKSGKSLKRNERKLSKMLLAVCTCYVTLNIPNISMELFNSCVEVQYRSTQLVMLFEHASDIFYTGNCAVNFVLYMTMSSKFSHSYKQLICLKKK